MRKKHSEFEHLFQPDHRHAGGSEVRLVLAGCAALFSLGNIIGWLAPQIIYGAMHHYGVLASEGGLLTLVEGGTIGLVTLLFGARPPRVTHRKLAILGVGLFILANAASPAAPTFQFLLVLRGLAGFADAILAFVAVSLVAIRSRKPDSAFSILTAVSVILGAGVVATPPILLPQIQGLFYLPWLAVLGVLVVPFIAMLPRGSYPGRVEVEAIGAPPADVQSRGKFIFGMLIAFMTPACFQSFGLFAFSPQLGQRIGLSETTMDGLLGMATLASVLGPIAVGPAVKRLGHWLSLILGAALLFGLNLILTTTGQHSLFTAALAGNMMILYFIVPLLLGWAAEIDPTGRYSSIVMGALTLVSALTPCVAGAFVDLWGLGSLKRMTEVSGFVYLGLLLLLPVVARRGVAYRPA